MSWPSVRSSHPLSVGRAARRDPGVLPLARNQESALRACTGLDAVLRLRWHRGLDDAAQAALEKAACDLARQLGVDHLEMRNRRRRHPAWPCKDLYVTFRKEISADAEQNMLAIPRKQRAMVRKGIKEELRAEVDETVDRHYEMYSESLRNLGTPVFAKRYLEILKDVFGEACDIVTILKGDRPSRACSTSISATRCCPTTAAARRKRVQSPETISCTGG